ncbi:MAG: PEP-CTERM sorting domain-containing protein [bacterium]
MYGSVSVPPITEPGTLILLGSGLIGIVSYSKFRLGGKKK